MVTVGTNELPQVLHLLLKIPVMQSDAPLKTFICYAHEDHEVVEGLKKHLAIFEKKGLLQLWSDGKILAGEHWDKSIKGQLEQAELILLFLSVDFINSEYIETTELEAALQRHREDLATLIPIIVRPCHWQEYFDIGKFQALPLKARPILSSHFLHRDEAFFEIAEGVRKTADGIRAKKIAAALAAEAQRTKEAAAQKSAAAAALADKEAAAAKALAAKKEAEHQRRQADGLCLKDEATWESATEENTLHAYETYLDEGFALHKSEAEKHIKALQSADLKRKAKEAEARKAKEEKRALFSNEAAAKTVVSLPQMFRPGTFLRNMVNVKGGTFHFGGKIECTLGDFAIGKYPVFC